MPEPPKPQEPCLESDSDLQAAVEAFLTARGYLRSTAANVTAAWKRRNEIAQGYYPFRGFFFHLAEAEGNPFMPDLLVVPYPNDRPALLLELKTRPKYQPGQKEAIGMRLWRLAFGKTEAETAIEEWENAKNGGSQCTAAN